MTDTIDECTIREIKNIQDGGETPVRLAVYSGNYFLAYKRDSHWNLSEDFFKVHPLRDAYPNKHLAKNLLFGFNNNSEFAKGTWFKRFDSVRVVVEDVSERNFGKKLLEYEVIKKDDKYVLKGGRAA